MVSVKFAGSTIYGAILGIQMNEIAYNKYQDMNDKYKRILESMVLTNAQKIEHLK
jgi:hypothetical protein